MSNGALRALVEIEGYESESDMMEALAFESVVPAICIKCQDYTVDLEPDAYGVDCCEICDDGGKVVGALVLLGII